MRELGKENGMETEVSIRSIKGRESTYVCLVNDKVRCVSKIQVRYALLNFNSYLHHLKVNRMGIESSLSM